MVQPADRRSSLRRLSSAPPAHLNDPPSDLNRNFSFIGMLGLAFAILNSWTALAASLSLALPSGGPTSVLWGLITAGICNLALAASLAEFLSSYPTAAGQAFWVYCVAPDSWKSILSYMTGWINVAGWIALTATAPLLGSQLIVGAIALWDRNYAPQRWQQFLIYIGYTLFAFIMNTFANAFLPLFNQMALTWSLAGFTLISIVVLITSRHDYADAQYVFGGFDNLTGWPDGLAWILGLLQGGFGLTGFDAVAHMIEEIPNPRVEGPKVMVACIGIGMFTGFIFLMILLFVSGGAAAFDTIISAPAGPLLQVLYTSTNSKAGATCLLMFPLICLIFAATAIMTTSSRMTWSFARSHGVPFSAAFSRVHGKFGLPLNSLYATTAIVILFGCIFLGSSAALNAIVSASVVALGVSYAMPVAVNLFRGRSQLPEDRPFKLPGWFGWTCNIVGVLYVLLTSVLFVFPSDLPVTALNMNYCIVAFAIVLVVATLQWVFDGRKRFRGDLLEYVDQAFALEGGRTVDAAPPYELVEGMSRDEATGRDKVQ